MHFMEQASLPLSPLAQVACHTCAPPILPPPLMLACSPLRPGCPAIPLLLLCRYPPHWVPLPMLYEAMQYVDPVTEQPRCREQWGTWRGAPMSSASCTAHSPVVVLQGWLQAWRLGGLLTSCTPPPLLQGLPAHERTAAAGERAAHAGRAERGRVAGCARVRAHRRACGAAGV